MKTNQGKRKMRTWQEVLPIDEKAKIIDDVELEMLDRIRTLGQKRTRYIKLEMITNDLTLAYALEAAYIQGMTDAALCTE